MRDLSTWFDEAKQDGNPYLSEWFAAAMLSDRVLADVGEFTIDRFAKSEWAVRKQLTAKYAWAIPCNAALDVLAACAPLIEMGAGTGYWAWLLRKRGVDIQAFDLHPPPHAGNHWHKTADTWTAVEKGSAEKLKGVKDRTLFLCWPPYDDAMALQCLQSFPGERLILIGENGGCTGDEGFFELLEAEWSEIGMVELPQFKGIHDFLGVWQRGYKRR